MVKDMKNKKDKNTKFFNYNFFFKNRKGWIEIVEAFVAVLLVAGVLLVILNKGSLGKTDISDQVYTTQVSILREIETNATFRTEILAVSSLPSATPSDIQGRINLRTPNYLNCTGRLCAYNDTCSLSNAPKKDIYAQSILITSTLQKTAYVQLKLFCWTK
jgi:hypothetical protein